MVAETKMPESFYQLAEHMEASSVNTLEVGRGERARLFQGYNEEITKLKTKQKEVEELIKQILVTNTSHTRNYDTSREEHNYEEIMKLLTRTEVPDVNLAKLDTGGAELAIRPDEEIRQSLVDAVAISSRSLLSGIAGAFEALVDARLVGHITWMAEDVCRFSFFKNVIHTERHKERVFTKVRETDYTRTFTNTRIVHDVIDARRIRLRKENMKGMRLPQEARTLVNKVPEWLASAAYIVEGQEIRVSTEERTSLIDSWTEVEAIPVVEPSFDPDPALVLGEYVLTAW